VAATKREDKHKMEISEKKHLVTRAEGRIVSAVPATQILYEGLHVKLSRISILEKFNFQHFICQRPVSKTI